MPMKFSVMFALIFSGRYQAVLPHVWLLDPAHPSAPCSGQTERGEHTAPSEPRLQPSVPASGQNLELAPAYFSVPIVSLRDTRSPHTIVITSNLLCFVGTQFSP